MTSELSTTIVLVFSALIVISDIPLALDKINGNTWSEVIRNLSLGKLPSIPFICGYLSGHWFMWKLFNTPFWLTLLILVINIGVIQLIRFILKRPFNKYAISILFIVGFIHGWLFWSM